MGLTRALGHAATVAALSLLGGCNSASSPTVAPEVTEIDVRMLRESIAGLQRQLLDVRLARPTETTLSLKETGFSVLDAGLTSLSVQMTDVTPAGAGSEITINVGNPSSADISSLSFAYQVLEPGADESDKPPERAKIASTIRSGAWTNVTFKVDQPPAKVGGLMMRGLSVERMELNKM